MFESRRRYRQIERWCKAHLGVTKHRIIGFPFQKVHGGKVFLRDRGGYISRRQLEWLCRDVYFREYLPQPGDTVVDIGAGYGHEALYCQFYSPGVRYIGIEIQPSVYECLANTFSPYRPNLRAFPMAISDEPALWIDSSAGLGYESVRAKSKGAVEIPTISWHDFLDRLSIGRISLLKVNIEGGERHLLPALGTLVEVDRVIVGAHDFRADRGEGEHFRTRQFVIDYLRNTGFAPRSLRDVAWWRDWIFADRSTL